MTHKFWLIGPAILLLSACEPTSGSGTSLYSEAPEAVREIAGPFQDLNAVRIDPIDGCYVYRHNGPVETTALPLRTKNGRPICTRVKEPAA